MDELQRLIALVPDAPARKVSHGHRGNRGRMSLLGQSVDHESHLERDFLLIMQFDPTLAAIRAQPFTIPCTGANGRPTRYTPDFLAIHGGPRPQGFLVEIKPIDELRRDWRNLKPRLRAGRDFARANGLTFEILTERRLRRWPLDAYHFLAPFRTLPYDESTEEHLIHTLAGIGPSTPQKLLAAAFMTRANQIDAIPFMWKLVATRRIMAGLDEGPLDIRTTPLWIDRDSDWRRYNPYSRKHLMRMEPDR